jgi:hypothetical protein
MGSIYKHRKGKPNESPRYCYTVKIAGRWREFIGYTDKDATLGVDGLAGSVGDCSTMALTMPQR